MIFWDRRIYVIVPNLTHFLLYWDHVFQGQTKMSKIEKNRYIYVHVGQIGVSARAAMRLAHHFGAAVLEQVLDELHRAEHMPPLGVHGQRYLRSICLLRK